MDFIRKHVAVCLDNRSNLTFKYCNIDRNNFYLKSMTLIAIKLSLITHHI